MKHEKIDVVEVCKELEDVLAPRLKLPVLDRAVYSHLLRHSRFEGKPRLRFSILWLAHNLGITARRARGSLPPLWVEGVLSPDASGLLGYLGVVGVPGGGTPSLGGPIGTGERHRVHRQGHVG